MEGSIVVKIGSLIIDIHVSIINWLMVSLFTTLLLVFVGNKFKKADVTKAPKGIVLVFEEIAKVTLNVVKGNLKEKTWKYIPLFGTTMMVMLISNLLGLIGLQPPTSNLSVNATLSIMMFILIQFSDIKLHGIIGKLKAWASPMVILFPLNVIGDLALPVSLTLRLFGNMLGGSVIIALIYLVLKSLMPFSFVGYAITPFLHMYFDVFTAFMQTYIYYTLASFFLGGAIEE